MTWSWLISIPRDIRYTLRALRRSPAFTIPAVGSLALGIAVNTLLFTVVNAALLRPLGGRGDGELVRIGRSIHNDGSFRSVPYRELRYLREHGSFADAIAGHQLESMVLTGSDQSEVVSVETVTANYFPVLGVDLAVGRGFGSDDDRVGAAPVLVLSDRFWRRRLGADPSVVGATIRLNDRAFTIIGVAPRGFPGTFPGVDIDLWMPAMLLNVVMNRPDGREPMLMLLARLKRQVSIAAARAELQVFADRLIADDPDANRSRGFTIAGARGIHPGFARVVRPFLLFLMAVVGLVLVIGCTNVAGLLLARANVRRGELAIRLAIGAGRGRLILQLLVESVVLAMAGGLAGLLLAYWPVRLLNEFDLTTGPTGGAIFFNLQLDTRVLLFTTGVAMLTSLVFGLVPSLHATRIDVATPLKESAASLGPRRSRLRSAVLVAQVALSCVLLVAAALLFKGLREVDRMDPGFDPGPVAIATFDLRTLGADRQRIDAFHAELLRRVRSLPGVERAALADFVPMGDAGAGKLRISTATPTSDTSHSEVPYGVVSDDYFATVQQPVVRGREFSAGDRRGAPSVAIVNEALVRRFFPGQDGLGRRLRLMGETEQQYEIVGVVRDARFWQLSGEIGPLVLLPADQHPGVPLILHVRTAAPSMDVLAAIRRQAAEIDRTVPFSGRAMREAMGFVLIPLRIARFVFAVAGVIGLLMSAIGLYALVWYTLEQRIKEIGVRVALGATRHSVFRLIVGSAVRLTLVGVSIGLLLAGAGARLLSGFLHGVSPTDPAAFLGIATLLVSVAILAGYAAARKGLHLDPVVALRRE